jgi:hypothetical protein
LVDEPLPSDPIYISRRLTTEIVQKRDAARPRRVLPERFDVEGVGGIELGFGAVDRDNDFALAREATMAIKDETGSLSNPQNYMRFTIPMHACTFNLFSGWESATNRRVGGFCASEWVDGVGRVFIALFGSLHNFRGYAPDGFEAGFSPSDADGLYQILDDVMEPEDPTVSPKKLESDLRRAATYRCQSAAATFFNSVLPPKEPLEVLAQRYFTVVNVDLAVPRLHQFSSDPPYALALLGSAVWAARPHDSYASHIPDEGREIRHLAVPEAPDGSPKEVKTVERRRLWRRRQ